MYIKLCYPFSFGQKHLVQGLFVWHLLDCCVFVGPLIRVLLDPFRFRNRRVTNLILTFILGSKNGAMITFISRLVCLAVHLMLLDIAFFLIVNFVIVMDTWQISMLNCSRHLKRAIMLVLFSIVH